MPKYGNSLCKYNMFKIDLFECQYLIINKNVSMTYGFYLNFSLYLIFVYTFILLCVILYSTSEVFMIIVGILIFFSLGHSMDMNVCKHEQKTEVLNERK